MLARLAGKKRWSIAVTLVTAATFVAVALRFGIGPPLPAFWYLAAVAVPLAFIDARQRRLPDALTLPSYPVALLLLGLAALGVPGGPARLVHALAGMAAAVAFFGLLLVVSPAGLGQGDVKLAGVLGIYLGWLGLVPFVAGMVAGWLLAGLAAAGLLVSGRVTRRSQIALGPFLIAGSLAVILVNGPGITA